MTAKRAHVQPGGHVKLSASLEPLQSGVKIRFERLAGGAWVAIKAVPVAADGTASTTWTPPRGTSIVRARFAGSTWNAPTTSAKVIVKS